MSDGSRSLLSAVETFRETVKRWRLFEAGEPVLVAVSGGVDSVVLLHFLLNLPPPLRPKVSVVHFNHHLRGSESDDDVRFVEELCRRWEVPCHVGEAPAWRTKQNLQARARDLRYLFFRERALDLGFQKILTAHQADDQAETFLIRWLQGAGLKGLAGIPLLRKEEGVSFVRPLLLIGRKEIEAYAQACQLPFRVDPTNEGSVYLRSRVRRWLSLLKKENPRISERSAVNALFLQADQAFLEKTVESLYQEGIEKRPGGLCYPLSLYSRQPEAIRYRLLQRMVRELTEPGASFPAQAVLKVDELLTDPRPRCQLDLPKGIGLTKDYVRFELGPANRNRPPRKGR